MLNAYYEEDEEVVKDLDGKGSYKEEYLP